MLGDRPAFLVKDGLTSDFVTMLEPGAKGGLLVGTVEGLSRFDGERFAVIAGRNELGEGVRAIAEDAAGRIWVGAGDGTLHRFAPGEHLTFGQNEGLPDAVIRCLLATADGSLWIGTDGGGLCRWREGKVTRWTRQEGLWEDVITQLQMDAAGDLWCGSPRGLFRIDRQQLERAAAGRKDSSISTHFGRSDGLANFTYSSEFHPRSWRAHDGRLLFATQKGVVLVDSKKLRGNPSTPNVLIEEIRINDTVLASRSEPGVDEPLEIGPGVRSLEFAFAAPSFTAPDKVRVRYRIDGLDTEWREAHDTRSASYLHVGPGAYRFRVIASDADGAWNETGAALAFHSPSALLARALVSGDGRTALRGSYSGAGALVVLAARAAASPADGPAPRRRAGTYAHCQRSARRARGESNARDFAKRIGASGVKRPRQSKSTGGGDSHRLQWHGASPR
jgi:hypothetical protein